MRWCCANRGFKIVSTPKSLLHVRWSKIPRYLARITRKSACAFVSIAICSVFFRQLNINAQMEYLLDSSRINNLMGVLRTTPSAEKSNRPIIAVIAYGLPRSLRFTISSIQQNIIAPLEEAGFGTCIYAHTYLHSKIISNARSRETNITLDNEEINMLRPCKQSAEQLESVLVKQSGLLKAVKQHGDGWRDGYETATRYLLALHSLRVAVELALSSETWHVGMVIIRPDLLYHDRLDVELLTRAISLNSVVVPRWHTFGGLNDRFSFGAVQPMSQIGTRYNLISEYLSTRHKFHAERFMGWAIAKILEDVHGHVLCTSMTASRVRAHGKNKRENFSKSIAKICA